MMGDGSVFMYGGVVSFIALGGGYIYLRQAYRARAQRLEQKPRETSAQLEASRHAARG